MIEIYELRIWEEYARALFAANEGTRPSDLIRVVKLTSNETRFAAARELHKEIISQGKGGVFSSWNITRRYTAQELSETQLFKMKVKGAFEPAGEECGTLYDETAACSRCGSGAKQTGPLHMTASRIPRSRDFSRTIAGEILVSRRAVEAFWAHDISGCTFGPVVSRRSPDKLSEDWYQLIVKSEGAEVTAPTLVGNNPFDFDERGEYRCVNGDLLGLNLLSEVSITRASRGTADMVCSRQFVGLRRGLLRPEHIILVSPKVQRLVTSEKLKGLEFEIAYLV